ncbi:MAG: hypothetical protein J7L23_00645 [Candidatus Diapherotrites archaeon]|nr:hypothetical protein [Candidatus Diapherotrites archaeon]
MSPIPEEFSRGYLGEITVKKGPVKIPLSVYRRGSLPRVIKGKPPLEKIQELLHKPPPSEVHAEPKTADEISSLIHNQLAIHLKAHRFIGENWIKTPVGESKEKLAEELNKKFPDAEFVHKGYCDVDLSGKIVKLSFHERTKPEKKTLSELIRSISESEWEIVKD